MTIELYGGNVRNFGAELMLRTVVSELTDRCPDVGYSAIPAEGGLDLFAHLGIRSLLPSDGRSGLLRTLPFRTLRMTGGRWRRFLQLYGLADPVDAAALVDLSGFRLSDQWGAGPAEAFAKLTRVYGRGGRPVVLLPQAFGPFQDAAVATATRRALEPATLVFARDSTSAHHLQGLGLEIDVRIAPDVTLFGTGSRSDPPDPATAPVTVVPNARLLDRPGHHWSSSAYLDFLLRTIGAAQSRGLRAQVLLHTTEHADFEVAQRLVRSAKSDVEVVRPADAMDAKIRLGASWAVIGSRFHAVAGALSASRPAMAVGWSHKYVGLLEDFGVPEFLVEPDSSWADVDDLLEELLSSGSNTRISASLTQRRDGMRPANEAMWGAVRNVLASA